MVTGFNNIGAISLTLEFDNSVLHFIQGIKNPLLPGSFYISDNDEGNGFHRLVMGWFGAGISLDDSSSIMDIQFTYLSGITSTVWIDNGGSCEYADGNYQVLNDIPSNEFYINGFVCGEVGIPGLIYGDDNVCQGQSGESYSIDPVMNATGYIWSVQDGAIIITGQNTNAITVDFTDNAVSGNISVYGINACGNGPITELTVTVNELPVGNAGNDTTINYGTSTTLHAASGGTGVFAYHWSPEALLVDPDVQNPQTVILTTTTVFSLTITNISTLCQNNDEMTVTITGGPLSVNPIAMPASVCLGESAQLYANAGGGSGNYLYQWTSDPPGDPPWSSTLPNPVVSPESSGHYLLTVFDGFTAVSGLCALTVSPLPSAFISGGDTLCGINVFTTLQVDLTGIPPWSFTYSYGNTSVFITNQQTSPYLIIASDAGDYTITAVEDANCEGTSYGIAIVRKYPVPATPEIAQNLNELMSSSCCGNQWYLNDSAIPGATDQIYIANENGAYFVIVTLNSCSSEPSEVVDLLVGINESSSCKYILYPNPAKDLVNIQITQKTSGNLIVSLYSVNGINLKTFYFKEDDENVFTIDISNLAPGLYFLVFSSKDMHWTGKLVLN